MLFRLRKNCSQFGDCIGVKKDLPLGASGRRLTSGRDGAHTTMLSVRRVDTFPIRFSRPLLKPESESGRRYVDTRSFPCHG